MIRIQKVNVKGKETGGFYTGPGAPDKKRASPQASPFYIGCRLSES